jgi:hypothetical protein
MSKTKLRTHTGPQAKIIIIIIIIITPVYKKNSLAKGCNNSD